LADLPRFALRRLLFLADFRADFLVDFLAEDLRADFFAPFLADFFADLLPDRLPDFLVDFLAPALLALLALLADLRGRAVRVRAGSSPSSYDEAEDAGAEEGVFSIGSGSIHPEPDQPISI
jgi:hypothetical protein